MEKKLWEKILKMLPNSELINLVKETNVPIPPGFRADSLHRHISKIRTMLIQNILKDQSFFKSILYYELKISENEDCENIRGQKREEILAKIKEIENPYLFIISLLTSKDEGDQKNGEYLLNEYENQKHKQTQNEKSLLIEEKENPIPQKMDEVEKELKKKNKKIKQLEQNIANLKNSFTQESAKWAIEKKKLKTENNEIKKENREKENLIKQLQKELEEMQQTLSSIKSEHATNPINHKKVESQPAIKEEIELPRVALIGKEIHFSLLNHYDVTIIQSNEIDQFNNPNDYCEIWILTFELTRSQLFKLRTNLQGHRVVEFHNIKELEKYIYQERRGSLWQANGTLF